MANSSLPASSHRTLYCISSPLFVSCLVVTCFLRCRRGAAQVVLHRLVLVQLFKWENVFWWHWSRKCQVQLADSSIFQNTSRHHCQDQLGVHRISFTLAIKAFARLSECVHQRSRLCTIFLDSSVATVHAQRSLNNFVGPLFSTFTNFRFKKTLLFALCCQQSSECAISVVHRQLEWLFKIQRIRRRSDRLQLILTDVANLMPECVSHLA